MTMSPQKVSAGLSHCDEVITLDCIRALYNFHYDPVASKENSVGLGMYILLLLYILSC